MEISGSTNSLIELGTAMSAVRMQNAMSINAVKRGLNAQSQAALSMLEIVRVASPPPNSGQAGNQIDLIA